MADITYTTQAAIVTAGAPTGETGVSTLARALARADGTQTPSGYPASATLVDGTTVTVVVDSITKTSFAKVTLAGNRTLAISGAIAGTFGTLIVTQDATGSRTLTLPTGKLAPSSLISTTANAVDWVEWLYDGTNYYFRATKALS